MGSRLERPAEILRSRASHQCIPATLGFCVLGFGLRPHRSHSDKTPPFSLLQYLQGGGLQFALGVINASLTPVNLLC